MDDAYEVQASGSVGSRHTHSGVCGGVVERTPRPRSCVRRCCARPLGLLGHLEMDADRPDVGRRSTGDRALGLRIIEDTYARHAGAIGSVAGASRAAGLIRGVPAEKSHREPSGSAGRLRARQPRLGTGHRPALGRPRPAGEVIPSKFGPCNSFETMKSRMMDHGSERRKVGSHGGVFHCYIAAYGHERPRRGRKPSVEGRAGPWEASGVRRCYATFSVGGKGLTQKRCLCV